MNEIDISDKVKRVIKFGLPSLLVLSVVISSMIWYALYGTGDLVVRDARVSSSMVGARARVSGTVSEAGNHIPCLDRIPILHQHLRYSI